VKDKKGNRKIQFLWNVTVPMGKYCTGADIFYSLRFVIVASNILIFTIYIFFLFH